MIAICWPANTKRNEAQIELDKISLSLSQLKQTLVFKENDRISLSNQIDSIPAERLDIKALLREKQHVEKSIVVNKDVIEQLRFRIIGYDENIQKCEEFLSSTNIEELLEKKKRI
jgi:hypothetical protein